MGAKHGRKRIFNDHSFQQFRHAGGILRRSVSYTFYAPRQKTSTLWVSAGSKASWRPAKTGCRYRGPAFHGHSRGRAFGDAVRTG